MDINEYFEFFTPPRIAYGPGALKQIGRIAAKIGAKKPFLVMDRIFVDKGVDKIIEKSVADAGLSPAGLLTDIPPDSDIAVIRAGYEAAAASGADLLIALGGGSTIDTAKGMRVMLGMGGALPEGMNVITKPLPPMIAVPTTAGTGSECTSAAVIRDTVRNLKISYTDPALVPTAALLDPELTASLPAAFTAGTGMDALTHAIESMHSTNNNLISDGLALQAIRLIMRSLRRAVADGNDMAARGEMLLAATIAGMAFSNTLIGLAHAAAHASGAAFRVPHGLACGLFLPYAMEFNMDKSAPVYAQAAAAMGIDTSKMSDIEAGMAAARKVRELYLSIGLPKSLKDADVPEDGLDTVAQKALMDGTMVTNPKPMSEIQMKTFMKKVWLGEEPCGGKAPAVEAAKKQQAAKPEPPGEPELKPISISLDDVYELIGGMLKKLFAMPQVTAALQKSGIKIRFAYYNENWGGRDAMITADCAQNPIAVEFGPGDIAPAVTMRMHSETARKFWHEKLNLMNAISKQEITIDGPLNEAMMLLPSIVPGFALYREHEKQWLAARGAAPAPAGSQEKSVTLEEMNETIKNFSGKLFTIPEVVAALQKSGIKIRFVYFNEEWGGEEVWLTADCAKDPIDLRLGPCDIEPIVTMRMNSETARKFWLQKLNLMSAITKGDITVEGSLNEAMMLLPAIRPGFALFKQIDEQMNA